MGGIPVLDRAIEVAAAAVKGHIVGVFADLLCERDNFLAFIGLSEQGEWGEKGEDDGQKAKSGTHGLQYYGFVLRRQPSGGAQNAAIGLYRFVWPCNRFVIGLYWVCNRFVKWFVEGL